MSRLILASRSPQRRGILEQLDVAFEVIVSDVDELTDGDPLTVAVENARRKALAVPGAGTVLGVDTIVVLDGLIYGKPSDETDARRTLTMLSGRVHEVISGLAVAKAGEFRTASAITRVRFRELDDAILDWYLASGEWRERAGGYAIQGRGAALVAGIEGDYLNVVGLPVSALIELCPDLLS